MKSLLFAYLGHPHTGGTYSVFKVLRSALALHNVEVRWVGLGPNALEDVAKWSHREDAKFGEVIGGDEVTECGQAERLLSHLNSNGYDGVFVNVLSNRIATNAIRYLDSAIKRIMIVHNVTPGTYAAARSMRRYVDAAVGVSPRICDDLVAKLKFDRTRTKAIPNAIHLNEFQNLYRQPRLPDDCLKLVFLGRIKEPDKGVMWLPEILNYLQPGIAELTVAGDGPDLDLLRSRCEQLHLKVKFTGCVPHKDVPRFLSKYDVYLFPSRFEGLGISLVEAMAAGCVPIASRIRGVTDYSVNHGVNGFLFPIGNCEVAANHVRHLASNPKLINKFSAAAQCSVRDKFSITKFGEAYFDLICNTLECSYQARSLPTNAKWRYPYGLTRGWRYLMPSRIKNLGRRIFSS